MVVALLLGGCNARTTVDQDAPDAGKMEDPLVFNPDTIDLGASKNREFRFPLSIRNRSKFAVRIEGIDKSCGCTVVNMTLPCDVPAGSTIHTAIQFAYSESSRGAIAQHIKLRTNDPRNPIYRIPVTGILEGPPEVKLQPEIVHLGTVGAWEAPSREVRLQYSGSSDWEVKSVTSSDPHLTAVFDRKEIDGAVVYRVTLQKGFQAGSFREYIEFVTTNGAAYLEVEGEQEGNLYITPAFLQCRGKQFPVKRILLLRHAPEYSPEITEVRSEEFQVSLESVSSAASGVTRVILSLNPKTSPPMQGLIRMTLKGRGAAAAQGVCLGMRILRRRKQVAEAFFLMCFIRLSAAA
jgi:hypothetical protein